jgi:hypothetical protein
MLDKTFRRSDAIDREAHCTISGERISSIHLPNPSFPLFFSFLIPHPP